MDNNRKVILYIAMSLDGYIAKPNDDLGFLSIVAKEGEDYGYEKFVSSIDTVILGRKTYDWVMKQVEIFPHANKKTFVITHHKNPNIGNINFYNGNLEDLINTLKSESGKNIFCDGGAQIVNELLKKSLIDEFIISIIPIMLGSGTKLFNEGIPEQQLQLLNVKTFETGLVQLYYKRF